MTSATAPTAMAHHPAEHWHQLLRLALENDPDFASGFLDPANPRRLIARLRRLFGRAHLEQEEVNILRGMLNSFRK